MRYCLERAAGEAPRGVYKYVPPLLLSGGAASREAMPIRGARVALIAKAGDSIDRASLLHKLSIDAITFKKLILTLEMSDLIESEVGEYGKVTYSLMAA